MVVNKRKKVNKYRAHTTHGGGHRKKRRGAGSRGGRGRAGTGKRASHKKAGMPPQLGSKGFHSHRRISKLKTINVGNLTKLVEQGKEILNLRKLGYDKLLGTGKINHKLKIQVNSYSAQAEEKIKAAGGEIISIESAKDEQSEVKTEKKEEQAEQKTKKSEQQQTEDKEKEAE